VPVINAGSGKDQHRRSIVGCLHLQRSFEQQGGIDGKTIVFVGDLARGRTVRSLSWLLTNYGCAQCFVAPKPAAGRQTSSICCRGRVQYELHEDFGA